MVVEQAASHQLALAATRLCCRKRRRAGAKVAEREGARRKGMAIGGHRQTGMALL